jgi:hypothetical protein
MNAVLKWLSGALALLPAGLVAGFGIGAGIEAVRWLKESSQWRRERSKEHCMRFSTKRSPAL